MINRFAFYIVFICLCACSKKEETIKPVYQEITQSVYATGIVKSKDQYEVFAGTQGLISKLYISEGDMVTMGQLLLKIHSPVAELNTESSAAAFNFNQLQNNTEKLGELENSVRIALQKKTNDSLLYIRQLNLWNDQIGTKNELEQKELNARNATANFENLSLQYRQLKKQLAYSEKQSHNSLAAAVSQQRELTVKSQVNGKVFSVLKKQGEMVTPQTPVAIVGGDKNLYLELQVDENDISQVTEGQQVYITMDSYHGNIFEATVTKIYPIMNERSRSFTVETIFIKQPPKLYPNLTAEANIIITHKEKALLVPRNYLVDDKYVLMKGNKKVPVETGLKDYKYAEIISGLTEKDEIINPR